AREHYRQGRDREFLSELHRSGFVRTKRHDDADERPQWHVGAEAFEDLHSLKSDQAPRRVITVREEVGDQELLPVVAQLLPEGGYLPVRQRERRGALIQQFPALAEHAEPGRMYRPLPV